MMSMLANLPRSFPHTPLFLPSSLLLLMKDFFKLQEELMFLLLQTLQFLPHFLNLKYSAGPSEYIILAAAAAAATEAAFWPWNVSFA